LENGSRFEIEETDSKDELVAQMLREASAIFLKKMSLNDWQWTEDPDKHQGGAYIFKADRDSGFFPPLAVKPRPPGKPEIREVYFPIAWPALGMAFEQIARLVNYRSKGEETHLTGLPSEELSDLAPASFLLILKSGAGVGARFKAVTVDATSSAYQHITDLFQLRPEFRSGIFEPVKVIKSLHDRLFEFVGKALDAFRSGRFDTFAAAHLAFPKPPELAAMARAEFRRIHANPDFNPFTLACPGDAVLEISRGLELDIYREFEVRRRSTELIQLILGNDSSTTSIEQALINIITEYRQIDGILLSAAQTRKSRAGASFELHIEKLLVDGAIPHEVQVVIESKKRPDFVLPSFKMFSDTARPREAALVLSAKTTLRERWKQVTHEISNCDLFLATVDESIAANAIEDMARHGIQLVVPESLKKSDTTVYASHSNVIDFKTFFETTLRERMVFW
jgi:hypothetical protein